MTSIITFSLDGSSTWLSAVSDEVLYLLLEGEGSSLLSTPAVHLVNSPPCGITGLFIGLTVMLSFKLPVFGGPIWEAMIITS